MVPTTTTAETFVSVPDAATIERMDTLRAAFLGCYLGLSRISDAELDILGAGYVVRRMRSILAEYDAEMARRDAVNLAPIAYTNH